MAHTERVGICFILIAVGVIVCAAGVQAWTRSFPGQLLGRRHGIPRTWKYDLIPALGMGVAVVGEAHLQNRYGWGRWAFVIVFGPILVAAVAPILFHNRAADASRHGGPS